MKWSGENHESKYRFYVEGGSCASEAGRVSLDLCAGRSSIAATQGRAGLGSDPRSDGQTLASSRQERGWRSRASVAGIILCAQGGLEAGQELALAIHGRILERERRGAALSWTEPSERDAHSGSRPHGAGRGRLRSQGAGGGQPVGLRQSARVGLSQRRDSLFGHDGAGAEDRLSTRTGNPQRAGRTLRAGVE